MTASFFDLSREQLTAALAGWAEPAYRARQVWQAMYSGLAAGPEAITTLSRPLREKLQTAWDWNPLALEAEASSTDGQTRKLLFRLADGAAIETVLMGYTRRRTVCLSTQAGCALGCVFCATGQMGFRRDLSAGEIVAQVLYLARALKARGDRVTHVVFMGMGEPLHNYAATLQAVDILNEAEGFNFGARRMTLSTVGLVPQIDRFTAERRQVNLAVSLHAATDDLRSQLLPINRTYPLNVLFPALRRYTETTHRRLTFEWALIQNVNDQPEQAHALAEWARGLLCQVNIIPLNPTGQYAGAAATRQRVAAFQAGLEQAGIPCTIRLRRGLDVNAGCGQLAGKK